ncbi:D-2-hydroxyacid dehydrogenase family protein [Aggregicoccus sp. 17bor-14]|uniref:D-2-hydroxyacid dehydrogenase family protein n=1 Tax=Myxococcaceae TaxID=31 RepID=UPI0012F0C55A|nr:D-2-hydroxyacid dehydrogenase family protein [Simulacricoccus sp. 17bor-14]MRI89025.1 D-2-hydroxyacid dehydrogenase family protein [Aggregicoccus sp. 17bor-14]
MKVAILDDYQGVALGLADWESLGAQVEVFRAPLPEAGRAERLRPFDVLVAMRERTPFPAALLAQLPHLRLLVTTGMRNASIDVAAARAQGITVCGTRAVGAPAAELTWGLLLALLKRIPTEDRALREGAWQLGLTQGLEGKRLGVVGLGKLGTQVARVGLAFGMDVVAWSPNLTDARAAVAGVRRVDKDALFATADVVTLHLVLSERTRGVVGAAELARMKPSAFLVNTARAGLVDEPALVSALQQGRLAGAGLDVFSVEPLPPEHPLRAAPHTVLTPHLGYVTQENYVVYYRDALEDIRAWAAGTPVRVLEA